MVVSLRKSNTRSWWAPRTWEQGAQSETDARERQEAFLGEARPVLS